MKATETAWALTRKVPSEVSMRGFVKCFRLFTIKEEVLQHVKIINLESPYIASLAIPGTPILGNISAVVTNASCVRHYELLWVWIAHAPSIKYSNAVADLIQPLLLDRTLRESVMPHLACYTSIFPHLDGRACPDRSPREYKS